MFYEWKRPGSQQGRISACRKSSGEGRARVQRERSYIPTYNEADNLKLLVPRILQKGPFDVLIVDDNSPDGDR